MSKTLATTILETCRSAGIEMPFGPITDEMLIGLVESLGRVATAESKLRKRIEDLADENLNGEGYASADELRRALMGWGPRQRRPKPKKESG